jgi:glutathione peroxidase
MKEVLNAYEAAATANNGSTFEFAALKGKPLLIVNTASKCGFTPQYEGLERLHKKYADKGLRVIGFPCDQFAHQEPGTAEEIASFCKLNYGVTFPIMEKIKVNGPETHPLFVFLKKAAPGALGKTVKWNFTKFLVYPDGKTVTRFSPDTDPIRLEPDIEKALGAGREA